MGLANLCDQTYAADAAAAGFQAPRGTGFILAKILAILTHLPERFEEVQLVGTEVPRNAIVDPLTHAPVLDPTG
jgi:hypothetical protein